MVVIDSSTHTAYEFWQARQSGGTWVTSWGGTVDIAGPGTPGVAVGSNISRLAGVVRTAEIAQGRIDHALVFSTNNACSGVYRYPAGKTDGRSSRMDCIPHGARIQLDPTLDVATMPGLTKAERSVAKALQTYGAYSMDSGGANMAFIFEDPSGRADPYPAAGLSFDYIGMDGIPWSKLRVLRNWNGS
jgi:hypothetical protein